MCDETPLKGCLPHGHNHAFEVSVIRSGLEGRKSSGGFCPDFEYLGPGTLTRNLGLSGKIREGWQTEPIFTRVAIGPLNV